MTVDPVNTAIITDGNSRSRSVSISSRSNHHHFRHGKKKDPLHMTPTTTIPPKKNGISHLFGGGKSSAKSVFTTGSPSSSNAEVNIDYIVEFEHYHPTHNSGKTSSIPPFRIIPPSSSHLKSTEALKTSTGVTAPTKELSRSDTPCDGREEIVEGERPRWFRTGARQPKSKSSSSATTSSPTTHRRGFLNTKRRMLPPRSPSSQSTIQTLQSITSSSSSSSCHTNGFDDDHTTPALARPINEYGDCFVNDWVDPDVVNSTTTAQMMLDISDQYYCIGKYYQYELCQPHVALQYYYSAYHVAKQCYRNVTLSSSSSHSNDTVALSQLSEEDPTSSTTDATAKNVKKDDDYDAAVVATTLALSSSSPLLLEEILGQIQLTKACIGRIHFELGNINEALEML